MNGCVKGKVGEREWRDFLITRGIAAKRGQQHAGGNDSPDVKSALDDFVHWEVKRVENLSIYPAMEQACNDARSTQIPVVAHRRNHKEWLCSVRGDDLIRLLIIAKNAGGNVAIQAAISEQVLSAPQPAAETMPIDWPESRGTTGMQLHQMQEEAEDATQQSMASTAKSDIQQPLEELPRCDENPAG